MTQEEREYYARMRGMGEEALRNLRSAGMANAHPSAEHERRHKAMVRKHLTIPLITDMVERRPGHWEAA